jgi:hypothetical protein
MVSHPSHSSESDHRVIRFRRHGAAQPSFSARPPIAELSRYQRGNDVDDYRHRMIVNVIAFAFVVVLMGVGLWIADTMAVMRKNQDCVLSGRRGCTPVEYDHHRRW